MQQTDIRPRVLILIDVRNWAFDEIAQGIRATLHHEFAIDIAVIAEEPKLDLPSYDILHVLGIKSSYHNAFDRGSCKILKSVFRSWWRIGGETPEEIYRRYAIEADALIAPTISFFREMQSLPVPVYLSPEGVDTSAFLPGSNRTGQLVAGWAGNPSKALKRFHLAQEACNGICELRVADGTLTREEMIKFYQNIDVLICTCTIDEGCPRTVLEGMSCGCIPLSFPVGAVPEVVVNGENGFIMDDGDVQAMRSRLEWCINHLSDLRAMRATNSELMRAVRDWNAVAPSMARVYHALLAS